MIRGIVLSTLFVLVVLAATSGPALAQEGDAPVILRTFDIGSIVAPYADCPWPRWDLPIRLAVNRDDRPAEAPEPRRFFEMDKVIELIRQFIDPNAWDERPDFLIEGLEGSACLLVKATSQHHQRISDLLGALSQMAQADVQMEVFLVRSAPGVMEGLRGTNGALGKPRIVALRQQKLRGVTIDASYTVGGRIGQRVRLRAGQTADCLLDFDVEVAQESKMLDPVVSTLFAGVSLVLRPTLMADGRVSIRLVGSLTVPPSVRQRSLNSGHSGVVQLLSMPSVHIAQSLAVENHSGAVLALGDNRGDKGEEVENRYLIIAPRWDAEWMQTVTGEGKTSVSLMRLGAWNQPTLQSASFFRTRHNDTPAEALPRGADGPRVSVSTLRSLVESDDSWDGLVLPSSDNLLVVAGQEGIQSARRRVVAAANVLQPKQIDVRLIETSRVAFDNAKKSQGYEWLGRVLASQPTIEHARLGGGLCLNGMAQWTVGQEFTYLADRDLEIATKAAALDPIIQSRFAGLEVRLRLRQRGEDQHVVEFDATLSGAGFGGAPEIFNGDSGLGVELAKGAANRMTGTAVAARFAPCILHQWQSGDRVHLLVVEVR